MNGNTLAMPDPVANIRTVPYASIPTSWLYGPSRSAFILVLYLTLLVARIK